MYPSPLIETVASFSAPMTDVAKVTVLSASVIPPPVMELTKLVVEATFKPVIVNSMADESTLLKSSC